MGTIITITPHNGVTASQQCLPLAVVHSIPLEEDIESILSLESLPPLQFWDQTSISSTSFVSESGQYPIVYCCCGCAKNSKVTQ